MFKVTKPWGYEYITYENSNMSLKILHMNKNSQTSLHCHPTKQTGIIILSGIIELNFISDSKIIIAPNKHNIRRGLFHQIKALTDDVVLMEIENPNDIDDLVRLCDDYGRSKSGYESNREEINGLSISSDPCTYSYMGRNIKVEIPTFDSIYTKNDSDIVVLLNGNLIKNINDRVHLVLNPGDIGFASVMKKVLQNMDEFTSDSILMTVS